MIYGITKLFKVWRRKYVLFHDVIVKTLFFRKLLKRLLKEIEVPLQIVESRINDTVICIFPVYDSFERSFLINLYLHFDGRKLILLSKNCKKQL